MPSPPRSAARDGARPHSADSSARKKAKPRVYLTSIARLTRVAVDEAGSRRTLHFLLHGQHGLNGPAEYVEVEHVPDFDGEVAWFEVEKIQRGGGHIWPWWRAIRQVEPPENA